MPFRFAEEEIKSAANLLTKIKEYERRLRQLDSRPKVWFRGLRDERRPLIPTFHRSGYRIADEIHMMNLFKQNAHEFLNDVPSNEWEWMFLMRHHGLPSRLMDWTENAIVGLYFAVRSRPTRQVTPTDGVLWCMLPSRLNNWSIGWPHDSECMPMFTDNESEFPLGENEAISNYLPSEVRLSASGRRESVPGPVAGICVRTNRRMQVQMGVFTMHHADSLPLEETKDGTHIWRCRIPKHRKEHILDELRILGVTERTVFPELDNVAIEASESLGGR